MNRLNNYLKYISIVAFGLVVYSCANRGYPEGGPKDETAPVIIHSDPSNGTLNFDKKKANIYFDEFVQLKEITEKFIISPPQKKKPLIKLRGKRVLVDFQDTLKENTTYSLDFGDAIVDNNEGNPMGDYRYYFSTGETIDTMRVGGFVYDAFTRKPLENMYVMLYENHADSIPLKEVASYVARTDTAGYFSVTNIKQANYRILAIEDANRNYIFESPAEKVGFIDTLIYPVCFPLTRRDTASDDTTAVISYSAFGPDNLVLYAFDEQKNQQYLIDGKRTQRNKLNFIFSLPRKDELQIDLLGIDEGKDWYITEHSINNDTVDIWIQDSTIFKRDSLDAQIKYLMTDTLGVLIPKVDTLNLNFITKKKVEKKKKRKKKDEEEAKKKTVFLKTDVNLGATVEINSVVKFAFGEPIVGNLDDKVTLYMMEDTLKVKQDIKITQDSLKIREFTLDYKWIPEGKYSLEVDSAVIYSVYGLHNDKVKKDFSVRPEDFYGKILLSLKNVTTPVVIQLIQGKKEEKVIRSQLGNKDGVYTFKYLKAGEYSFKIIKDINGNGKWDTGNYLKKRQAEEIIYLDKIIKVRQNWDFEQSWEMK